MRSAFVVLTLTLIGGHTHLAVGQTLPACTSRGAAVGLRRAGTVSRRRVGSPHAPLLRR